MGNLRFIKAGLFTSLQDQGRFGFRKFGVPISGAMDQKSAQLANLLVNNPVHSAVIEITLVGPVIAFQDDSTIAITGGNLSPQLNGKTISLNKAISIRQGDMLNFGPQKMGTRAYIAASGGFQAPSVLGSKSMYHPVTERSSFQDGAVLTYRPDSNFNYKHTSVAINKDHFSSSALLVSKGPEFELLPNESLSILTNELMVIGSNNRMGYRLNHDHMPKNDLQIITSPVVPGTIQLTPSGQLLVLMRDAQVTGGYPRVLQLSEESINRLAQKSTGQQAFLKLIEQNIR